MSQPKHGQTVARPKLRGERSSAAVRTVNLPSCAADSTRTDQSQGKSRSSARAGLWMLEQMSANR